MTIHLDTPDGFTPWEGQRIDGVLYPTAIAQSWTPEQLAGIGLYHPAPADAVPANKAVKDTTVQRVNGVVKYVNTLKNAPYPKASDVIAERERRLALGFDYDFGDERGVHHIGTTEQDHKGWDYVIRFANASINTGAPSAEVGIVTNTGPVTVTAAEWQAILLAGAPIHQAIWEKSFILMAMSPIPRNFTDDSFWT